MESIIVATITGGLALIGVIISNVSANKTIENNLKIAQAVTDTKLEALTEEVRKHNNFAVKIPVIENRLTNIENELAELKKAE